KMRINLAILLNIVKKPAQRIYSQHAQSDNFIPPNLVITGFNPILNKETVVTEVPDITEDVPVARFCSEKIPKPKVPIKLWMDNLMNETPQYSCAVHLHPMIFDTHPRMDILHSVVRWQQQYREVDYSWSRTRDEMGRGKKKPWPQKGTGRARHGSTNSPLWLKGGISHGPRGPRASFYELQPNILLEGLLIALTIKHIQNDLIIIESAEVPEDMMNLDGYLQSRNLIDSSLLLVHGEEENTTNIGNLVENTSSINLMPQFALNVYSILKHDKLLLSKHILDDLELKVMWQKTRYPWLGSPHNFYHDMP
uniref:Large ribosomal subunit protein uL4m n=1 Tax=Ciona savignyi TaxID=51511 RepID=H2Z2W3_CIOSA